jgi:DNA-directed RNA polymerase beta' subunit
LFLAKSDTTGGTTGKFTGNQLLSKIIPGNINLSKNSSWDKAPLEIVKGNIVSGVLDKGNAGQSVEGSLFHEIIISNGSDNALEVLSNLQEMVKRFNGYYTVSTIGVKDILFDYNTIREIRDYIKSCIAKVECLYANAYNGRLAIPAGKTLAETIENEEFKIMNTAGKVGSLVENSLDKLDNNILRLIKTGSKGNMSAAVSIFGTVGYITVDGGRMPYTMGNRCYLSSPNFPIDPVHKGCVLNPFRTGISNREIFAAATDARESFISNALNTAIAGTFTKNLNKCMDSMIIDYFYGLVTSSKMIQSLCYGTGFALHRLVKVKALSISLPKKKFLERYGLTEDDQLVGERDSIRNAFIEKYIAGSQQVEDN